MTIQHNSLAAIKRFDQLVAFLRDEMDWPIEGGDFEDLTFDYTSDELGIDTRNAAKIQDIKRLRPLAANQPWGVFFVKFEPKRLPVVALRSILGRVTLKRRASASDEDRPAWAMEDLLFISNYGEGEARQISFAHFAAPADSSKLPTLKMLGWDSLDTALHLEHVGRELTRRLAWPDDETDIDAWREQWRGAFTLGHREVITTAQQLAVHLAALARNTRDRISTVLQIEAENGRITRLMKSFREALLHDLDAEDFADMVAQSIAYGLLSARITDPQQGGTELAEHMRTNPLLRDLMSNFLTDRQTELDFDELGVAEVVDLLDQANIDAVLRDFGDRNPREDPVIHFYESFLAEYDRQKKIQRGVFYTPRPVVSYIVRSVDALLRSEFGLEDGLADTSTWAEMAKRRGLIIPEGVSPNQDFVQILDPATGTGTFLVEVIELIYKTLQAKWQAQGYDKRRIELLWNEYVPQHLLPRLYGYELLMAPYAIAHLKVGLKLYETGYRFGKDARARVYLTNALEPAQSVSGLLDFAIPALAREAQAVNEVKAMHRFTVVLGNPPYSGHSVNKGEWIRELLRGRVGNERVESYFTVDGKPLNERNPKWLNDDYVKFMRLANWQIERTGRGLVGFITNHRYLRNRTFPGMRESLITTFPEIHLLNLHGNVKERERSPDGSKDENVFDIQQGVAIGLFAKAYRTGRRQCNYADLWGGRELSGNGGKYGYLVGHDVSNTTWNAIFPEPPLRLLVPRDNTLDGEYQAGWSLTNIFPVNSVGIVTARDKLAIQWTARDMEYVAADFATREREEARAVYDLGKDSRDWKVQLAQEDVLTGNGRVRPIQYRPFDRRFTFYTGNSRGFICMPRPKVMRHMLAGGNIGLSTTRSTEIAAGWEHVFASRHLIQHHTVSLKEVNYLFPLYTYLPEALRRREANLDTSGLSRLDFRVKTFKLRASVLRGELPVDADLLPVAFLCPRHYPVFDGGLASQTISQRLAGQHAEFRFRNVEPTSVFRRENHLQTIHDPFRLDRSECRVQGTEVVRVQIVAHQRDALGARIARCIHQSANPLRPRQGRATTRHPHVPPATQRFHEHPDGAGPFANVFVVHSPPSARSQRHRGAGLGEQLKRLLIHAHDRKPRVVRPRIHLQNVLHASDEGAVVFGRNAPHGLAPRFQSVFFSASAGPFRARANRRVRVRRLSRPTVAASSDCGPLAVSSRPAS